MKVNHFLSFAIVLTFFACSNDDDNSTEEQSSSSAFIDTVFVDSRDTREYKIKDIGDGKIWFLENLANGYRTSYTWENAMKFCPAGWHLPNNEEWESLDSLWENNKADFIGDGWWSATEFSDNEAFLWYASDGLLEYDMAAGKLSEYAVRCVKDSL